MLARLAREEQEDGGQQEALQGELIKLTWTPRIQRPGNIAGLSAVPKALQDPAGLTQGLCELFLGITPPPGPAAAFRQP